MNRSTSLENSSPKKRRRVAWAPPRNQEVGSILVALGQTFEYRETYLFLLADRVEEMVKREEDPEEAERELRRQLDQAGLLSASQLKLRELVTSNPELQSRLSDLGVFPKPKEQVKFDNREARQLIEEIDLQKWLDHLTSGLDEHLT
jgi:hypothetical protein